MAVDQVSLVLYLSVFFCKNKHKHSKFRTVILFLMVSEPSSVTCDAVDHELMQTSPVCSGDCVHECSVCPAD